MADNTGIGFIGRKGVGKDFLADYIVSTRQRAIRLQTKTPIIEVWEKANGRDYRKGEDDPSVMEFSKILRGADDNIVADWIQIALPEYLLHGMLPIFTDVRRRPEYEALKDLGFLFIRIIASDETRHGRILARDGTLDHYRPNDITETEIDSLHAPYEIDNGRADGGDWALKQLENYLSRRGGRFRRVDS